MTRVSAANVNSYAYAASNSMQAARTLERTLTANDTSTSNNSAPDELSISEEGADRLEEILKRWVVKESELDWSIPLSFTGTIEHCNDVVEKKSTHISPNAWALGLDTTGKSEKEARNMLRDPVVVSILNRRLQTNNKEIAEKITGLLGSHSVILEKNESLNITLNQRGEMTIHGNVNEYKKEIIDNVFSENQQLGFDLLNLHAECAAAGQSNGNWSSGSHYAIIDMILQREYGVSLNDYQPSFINENNQWEGGSIIIAKNGCQDSTDFLREIGRSELAFFLSIDSAVMDLRLNGSDFTFSFIYKNGSLTDTTGESRRRFDSRWL